MIRRVVSMEEVLYVLFMRVNANAARMFLFRSPNNDFYFHFVFSDSSYLNVNNSERFGV